MGPETLKEAELRVLKLLSQGFNDKAISARLCYNELSVRKMIHGIYIKLEIEGSDINKRVRAATMYKEDVNGTGET
jgi:DNA-binding NarL/FixJ family response regulator